ncbi:MAG: HAD-IA family hydrolase [Thermoproteota archaeon]|nr:HAD-IA family hydrolase [Candidatus Brockarchaeota archaeon]MBO3768119.1 HAD-IA family hydrolase [Candidatus Brockarchaeota archaeon]MBO3801826.1 HAD-IA family hydrolase [Candidatus Brockarchaeota archaeon]
MSKFEAIIFDVDGTLFDSREAFYIMVYEVSKILGWKLPEKEKVIKLIGLPNHEISRKLVSMISSNVNFDYEVKRYEELVAKLWEPYYLPRYVKLYPGVKETLCYLKKEGIKMAVVSNGSKSEIPKYLKSGGIYEFFQVIITADDVNEPKPASEPILKVLRELNVSKEKCLMVGDTLIDGISARRAGVKIALLTWGIENEEEIRKFNPDYVLSKIEGLKELVTDP